MIVGVGTDILKMSRIEALTDLDDPFYARCFTEAERSEALSRETPVRHFCTKFSVKEAVLKALGLQEPALSLSMIEVLNSGGGRPVVYLHKQARAAADALGVDEIFASASFDGEYSAAVAICCKRDP